MARPEMPASTPPEYPNEGQLVAEYLERGDERLFAVIVARYKDQVFRLALSILGPYRVPDAEDVAQEVFMRIHRALPTFRQESSLGTWIYRLAFNIAVDHTRRARFRLQHLPEDALRSRPAAGEATDSERSAVIHAAMARLPGPIRSVLYLHYWLGCGVEEVAKHLGIPPGTVKSHLRRGRAQMHRMITGKRGANG
jgi:RNA polymerase sigma-70 factor (ECF subfamily)